MKNTTNFPPGWDEKRVRRVSRHYDSLNENAEDETAFEDSTQTVMEIPNELVPAVRALLADRDKEPQKAKWHDWMDSIELLDFRILIF